MLDVLQLNFLDFQNWILMGFGVSGVAYLFGWAIGQILGIFEDIISMR